ncbi:MAG: helix-hairpin-helix domain-containing protein [Thermoplasmata archaeon]|nr:helix-hairpin-helix domain-containing protein [Thermoplasmata archaeon]
MTDNQKRFTEDFMAKWSRSSDSADQNIGKTELTRLRKLLQREPKNPQLWFEYGQVHYSLGNSDEAWASFARAEALGADWPSLYLALGLCQIIRGKPEEAAAKLLDSLKAVCKETGNEYLKTLNEPCGIKEVTADIVREGFIRPESQLKAKAISVLMDVPGIGDLKANALYDAGFRNVEDLKEATVDELAQIRGIGLKSAQKIKIILTFQDRLQSKTNERMTVPNVPEDDEEFQCPLCGTILNVGEKVCYECGMILKEEEAVQAEQELTEQWADTRRGSGQTPKT